MLGKAHPPDIAGWEEIKEHYSKEMIGDKIFFETKCYLNLKSKYHFEAAIILSLWDFGPIVKAWAVKLDKEDERTSFYFLRLENDEWTCGKANKSYKVEHWHEEIGGVRFVNSLITLETEEGIKERLIIKKILNPPPKRDF